MHIRYGSMARLVTHGSIGDVVNRNYMGVMRIVDDLKGKELHNFDQDPTPLPYSAKK